MRLVLSSLLVIFIFGCDEIITTTSDKVYDIDGNLYTTIIINNQLWFAENLKTTRYCNGDSIIYIKENNNWSNMKIGAYCNYNNIDENADIYGRLYNWFAVVDPRCLAPRGWRIPDSLELNSFIKKINENENILSGYRYNNGKFLDININALFWSMSFNNKDYAWFGFINIDSTGNGYSYKTSGLSVRCIKN